MKRPLLILIAILSCGLGGASRSDAGMPTTTVRGQLLRADQSPAPGVQVTLNHTQFGRSSPATTGNDGMYYLYNVPYGGYYLEVWLPNRPPLVYQVSIGTFPYSDLPRVALP